MAIPSRRGVRSLRDIRTLSRTSDPKATYKTYQKLSSLEMAKLRLVNERESLLAHLLEIEERLRQIEAEAAALVRQLAGREDDVPADSPSAEGESAPELTDPRPGGLKLRY